jgi:RHS repeat-associated protein
VRCAGLSGARGHHQRGAAAGAYPGLDPFGRVVRQLRIDAGYAAGSVSGFADRPAVVDTSYAYTRLGSMTTKLDARPGATMLAQHAYTMDGLLRLLQDQRGTAAFSSAQAKPGSQLMAYDFIGNLRTYSTDTSDSGAFAAADTAVSDGAFNLVNEQTGSTYTPPPGTTPQALAFTWDDAGNLLQRGIAGSTTHTWKYKHDRWGRLTQVDQMNGTTAEPALHAQYSGLGMRCVVDRAPDSWVPPATPTISERRLGYFGASWQLLEEHVDHDYPLATTVADIDEVDQLVWGLRHIDDLVMRRVNANFAGGADTDWTDPGDREGDQFLNDVQFSVVAAVDADGALLERVEYDPYGQAQHHFRGDVNGAGGVTQADVDLADAAKTKSIGQSGYNADADIDRDGTVEQSDVDAIDAQKGTAALATGRISAYGNTVGWCGYRFNAGPNIYTVRYRHFDPTPGVARWLERDPAGYMDGASLYIYGGVSPTLGGDPYGLWEWGDFNPWGWEAEDAAWEEMMRDNREMVNRHLDRQVKQGSVSSMQARRIKSNMMISHEAASQTLREIRDQGKIASLETAFDIMITAIPGGVVAGSIQRVIRLSRYVPGMVAIGSNMTRVVRIAERVGVATYRNSRLSEIASATGGLLKMVGARRSAERVYKYFNRLWVEAEKRKGTIFLDYGPDPVSGAGRYWLMELKWLGKYGRIFRCVP